MQSYAIHSALPETVSIVCWCALFWVLCNVVDFRVLRQLTVDSLLWGAAEKLFWLLIKFKVVLMALKTLQADLSSWKYMCNFTALDFLEHNYVIFETQWKELNSHRVTLVHQHVLHFFVSEVKMPWIAVPPKLKQFKSTYHFLWMFTHHGNLIVNSQIMCW